MDLDNFLIKSYKLNRSRHSFNYKLIRSGYSFKYGFNLLFDKKQRKIYLENDFISKNLKNSKKPEIFISENHMVYIKIPMNFNDYLNNVFVIKWAGLGIKPFRNLNIEERDSNEVSINISTFRFEEVDQQKEENLVEVIGWQKLMNIELEVF